MHKSLMKWTRGIHAVDSMTGVLTGHGTVNVHACGRWQWLQHSPMLPGMLFDRLYS